MSLKRHFTSVSNHPGRRAVLGFAATGLAVPLGAMAPASWRSPRLPFDAQICRAAAEAVAPGSTPREIRLCWNANSVCHPGLAAAEQQGFFARHNLVAGDPNAPPVTVDHTVTVSAPPKVLILRNGVAMTTEELEASRGDRTG
jgi:ABC-type nitrate/sulfonate/bicarbonate transport system substrate-binding protein